MSTIEEVAGEIGVPPEEKKQKKLVFTMPGKKGDALHQFPIVYWYWKQTGRRSTLWLDKHTLGPLVNLFAAQSCVEGVELIDGITSWHMGGQKWDFSLPTSAHVDNEIYHLGLRSFPQRQLTLEALDQVPLNIKNPGDVKCLDVGNQDVIWDVGPPRLALHGTFVTHMSGVPGFWRFLADRRDELESIFGGEIYFTGTPAERKRARELYPDWKDVDDGGDFLHLARFMATCTCVIGAGSSNIVLAGLLGVPGVRVHDPIGENAKVIWSNLGPNQINETEMALRTEWPKFRDQWVTPK